MFEATKNDEQQMLQKVVSQIAEKYPHSYFLEKCRANEFPADFWKAFAENGFFGLEAEDLYGGAGMTASELIVLLHAAGLNGLFSNGLRDQLLACFALAKYGNESQRKTYLPDIVGGKRWSTARVEDVRGGDAFASATKATQKDGGYVLSGTKRYVAGAGEAEFLLVTARVAEASAGNPAGGLGVFIVPANAKGISLKERELGVRVAEVREPRMITGDVYGDVSLENVEVGAESLIGTTDGSTVVDLLSRSMLMTAAAAAGLGDRVIDQAVDYSTQRVLYSEPIAAYQAIQHPMVRAKTDVEMAKLFIERAVTALPEADDADDRLTYASIAKQLATEAAFSAFDISMQSHGGSAFDREVGLVTFWPLILMARTVPMNNDEILKRFGDRLLAG